MASQTIPKICSIKGCLRKYDSHGYCGTHWKRFLRHGHFDTVRIPNGERRPCSVEGCTAHQKAKGYCKPHSNHLYLYGDPVKKPLTASLSMRARLRRIKSDAERFWLCVEKTDSCWLWIGSQRKRQGYGRTKVNGQWVLSHRYSFFLANGYWPEPMCLHSCDNPPCVNPAHLRAGTALDNAADRWRKN